MRLSSTLRIPLAEEGKCLAELRCKGKAISSLLQINDCYSFCYTLLIFDISQQVTLFLFFPIFIHFLKFTIIFKAYARLTLSFPPPFLPIRPKFFPFCPRIALFPLFCTLYGTRKGGSSPPFSPDCYSFCYTLLIFDINQ